MIQASQVKPIETKAVAKAAAEVVSNNKAQKALKGSQESSGEVSEFAKELEASIAPETEAKVEAVKVSAEQAIEIPSNLVNPNGSVETTAPKVFDPSLTKSVDELVQPKLTQTQLNPEVAASPIDGMEATVKLTDAQVLELAKAPALQGQVVSAEQLVAEVPVGEMKSEVAQAMLKTPQVQGRAPAIEFAQAEIDPQLLGNEDFVAQKNMVAKKSGMNAYGMKAVPAQQQQQQKIALENGLSQTQVVKDASQAEGASVNSQQFILNMMNEQKGAPQLNEVQAQPKVFDMNNIKTTNSNEIINQITDYVIQAKASKEPTVVSRVNHDQLGMIDITVSKVSGTNAADAVAINIGAHTLEGKNFFQQNSKDLVSHMASAGINLTDVKVETPAQTAKNDFDFGSQSGRNQQGSEKHFGSEQNQRRHDSDRRQDLWKLLNQEAA